MFPYWILFVPVALCCFVSEGRVVGNQVLSQKRYLLWGCVGILGLFAGVRSPTSDRDYLNYVDWFNESIPVEDWSVLATKDPLFQVIGIVLRTGSGGLGFLMFAIAIIALSSKMRILRSPDYQGLLGIAFLFLISRFFLVHEFTQVRAALGISLASLGIIYALEGQAILALIFFFLGCAAHLSAFALAPMALYAYPAGGGRKLMACAVLLAFLAVLLPAIGQAVDVAARVLPYLSGGYDVHENSILSVYFLVKAAAVLALLSKWSHLNRGMRTAALTMLYGMVLTMAFLSNDVFSLRLSELTSIFDCICLAYLFRFGLPGPQVFRSAAALSLALVFFLSALNVVNDYQIFD